MSSLTIRKLDPTVKERLRSRAARQGRSMEEEARRILNRALSPADPEPQNAYQAIRRHFAPPGGVELEPPPRQTPRVIASNKRDAAGPFSARSKPGDT